jgi:hypothetical protein
MTYRGPGLLVVAWFSSLPAPPPFHLQVVSLSQSSYVSPVKLTDGRGWGGGVWGAESYDSEKACPMSPVPRRQRVLNDLQMARPSCGRIIRLHALPPSLFLSKSFYVTPVELSEGNGGGRGAESYDSEKDWPSINRSVLSAARPLRKLENRARIFKCLWGPGIDSKEWIPPAYVAWRAGTITLFLLGFYPP